MAVMPQDDFLKYEAAGIAYILRTRSLGVPFYQRSYSWRTGDATDPQSDPGQEGKLQVVDFWNDLESSFSTQASYFMGTVVLARDQGQDRGLVIDGQQRLATTSLLLAAIRDAFFAQGSQEFGNSIQQDYLGKFDRQVGSDMPKLKMNTEDRDFFERHVVKQDPTVQATNFSQALIMQAYTHLKARVDEFVVTHGTLWATKLNELISWLDQKVQIVSIDVATEADAFLIFETLNDRGADLTIADLLKNYLFSQAGTRLDEVRDNWVATLTNLDIGKIGNQRFTGFARNLLSTKYGLTRERDVYSRLKNLVSNPAGAVQFSQELKDASRHYSAIITADPEYFSDFPAAVGSAADVLVGLNLEQYRPLLLAALIEFPKSEIARFLPTLVSWVIRGLAAGLIGTGSAETAFCDAAKDIRTGKVKTTEEVLNNTKLLNLVPNDLTFEQTFTDWKVTRGATARYLLRALELADRGDAEPELVVNDDIALVNLEHILPKSAQATDWPAFTADEQRLYVHRLGNLCLLKKGANGRIGNKPWAVKQPVLAQSDLHLTSSAAAEPAWTKTAIEGRQGALAQKAVWCWPRLPRTV